MLGDERGQEKRGAELSAVAAVWPERLSQGGSLGFAVLAMLTAGAVVGIAANAGTLLVRRLVATRQMNVITAKW